MIYLNHLWIIICLTNTNIWFIYFLYQHVDIILILPLNNIIDLINKNIRTRFLSMLIGTSLDVQNKKQYTIGIYHHPTFMSISSSIGTLLKNVAHSVDFEGPLGNILEDLLFYSLVELSRDIHVINFSKLLNVDWLHPYRDKFIPNLQHKKPVSIAHLISPFRDIDIVYIPLQLTRYSVSRSHLPHYY